MSAILQETHVLIGNFLISYILIDGLDTQFSLIELSAKMNDDDDLFSRFCECREVLLSAAYGHKFVLQNPVANALAPRRMEELLQNHDIDVDLSGNRSRAVDLAAVARFISQSNYTFASPNPQQCKAKWHEVAFRLPRHTSAYWLSREGHAMVHLL
ncbi:hypothetical protein GQ600_12422 [Phytophthora cactorum]|nr:hypothetical protein GQ600_12422 [Phytophthora cactorum]